MKFLKYALGIIALLVLVFILIGACAFEIAYDNEITIDKSLAINLYNNLINIL